MTASRSTRLADDLDDQPPDAPGAEPDALHCPNCGAEVHCRRQLLRGVRAPASTSDVADGRGRRRRADELRATDRAHPLARGPRSTTEPSRTRVPIAAAVHQLRRRGRRRRLLRDLRHQGAERARPLHRAAGAMGRRLLRPGHPALPQRGRVGAGGRARARDRGPCWWSATGSPRRIDSDVASLAAARAARDVLVAHQPAGHRHSRPAGRARIAAAHRGRRRRRPTTR